MSATDDAPVELDRDLFDAVLMAMRELKERERIDLGAPLPTTEGMIRRMEACGE